MGLQNIVYELDAMLVNYVILCEAPTEHSLSLKGVELNLPLEGLVSGRARGNKGRRQPGGVNTRAGMAENTSNFGKSREVRERSRFRGFTFL